MDNISYDLFQLILLNILLATDSQPASQPPNFQDWGWLLVQLSGVHRFDSISLTTFEFNQAHLPGPQCPLPTSKSIILIEWTIFFLLFIIKFNFSFSNIMLRPHQHCDAKVYDTYNLSLFQLSSLKLKSCFFF